MPDRWGQPGKKPSNITDTATRTNTPNSGRVGGSRQVTNSLITSDENPSWEVMSVSESFLGPKDIIFAYIGAWNVSTITM